MTQRTDRELLDLAVGPTVRGLPEYLVTTITDGQRVTQVIGTTDAQRLKRDLQRTADRVTMRKLNNDWRLK